MFNFNFNRNKKMDLSSILSGNEVTLLDVREPFEFASGHAEGAVNIPLSLIPLRMDEIRQMGTPIVAYCRSGNRSGQAVRFLQKQGFEEVYNGGSLDNILRHLQPAS